MNFTVAILGRPNVGKSTLFNRLVGKRLALVDDRPGVTRDRREGAAHLGDLAFTAIDTAGLEEAETKARIAGRRLLLVGGEAVAMLLAFVLLAGSRLRSAVSNTRAAVLKSNIRASVSCSWTITRIIPPRFRRRWPRRAPPGAAAC